METEKFKELVIKAQNLFNGIFEAGETDAEIALAVIGNIGAGIIAGASETSEDANYLTAFYAHNFSGALIACMKAKGFETRICENGVFTESPTKGETLN